MDIEVWSVGKVKFTADPGFQEQVIREVIDQRGDVADAVIDWTGSEWSDISHDEYARVTGDVPGLVLFEGWLTGDRNAPAPVPVDRESAAFTAYASSEHERAKALTGLLAEILADLKDRDVGRRVLGQMPIGWSAEQYQVALWIERAEKAGVT